jgi:hypothetical protein
MIEKPGKGDGVNRCMDGRAFPELARYLLSAPSEANRRPAAVAQGALQSGREKHMPTVLLIVPEEAAAAVAELGMQRALDLILDWVRQNVPALEGIRVALNSDSNAEDPAW